MSRIDFIRDLAVPGPRVIGATGGSGTRVVARIVRSAHLFIGSELNAYEDAVRLGQFSDRWINDYLTTPDREALEARMEPDLESELRHHLEDLPDDSVGWGWKEPRSIYLLPFYDSRLPELRFLHFIRDGRDMAFSENQQQLTKHGSAVFGGKSPSWRRPIRSISLWNTVNLRAAEIGEQELGARYLRVRFEDLCNEPGETVGRILDFFGLEGDARAIGETEIRAPDSLGRWSGEGKRLVAELERRAETGLRRFGYL